MILQKIHKLLIIIFLIFLPIAKAMEREEDTNIPRLTVKKIVLHNTSGSLCNNVVGERGKEICVQLGFSLLKKTSGKSMAITNIITIKAGEKKTIVIPALPLWPFRYTQAHPGLVFYNQIDSSAVFLNVIWSTADVLNDTPQQSVLISPPFSDNLMKQTHLRRHLNGEPLQSSCTWLHLQKGTTIQIDLGTSLVGNENHPIVKFLQKNEEYNNEEHKDGG